jgi:hypothetical protein
MSRTTLVSGYTISNRLEGQRFRETEWTICPESFTSQYVLCATHLYLIIRTLLVDYVVTLLAIVGVPAATHA